MAVARMTAAHDNSVRTALERAEDEYRIHAAGAGNSDYLDIRRIGCAVRSGKVGSGVGTPVAAERHDLRAKFRVSFIHRHIASSSAIICLFEKPFRSIAPDGRRRCMRRIPGKPLR